MAHKSKIRVSSLDFGAIKASLKAYLKDTGDYNSVDFEGSNINVLMDVLAYNTHLLSLSANFAANEMFLDTAVKRSSIVSLAKSLGYVPFSAKASTAVINMTINAPVGGADTIVMPRGTRFLGTNEFGEYFFTTTEHHTANKTASDTYVFTDIGLTQGVIASEEGTFEHLRPLVELNNESIDTSTLSVSAVVLDEEGHESVQSFFRAATFLSLDEHDRVFFVQESHSGNFSIYFGDGLVGVKPGDNTPIFSEYVVTAGSDGNFCKSFALSTRFLSSAYVEDSPVTITPSAGGRDREDTSSIKFNSLNYFGSQDRAVTADDYKSLISVGFSNMKSIMVWGGEDNVPPKFGKIIFCIIPKYGEVLTKKEKTEIIELIKPKAVANLQYEFTNPDYLDISLTVDVFYNRKKLIGNSDILDTDIKSAYNSYANDELDQFGSVFRLSSLLNKIDKSNHAILSSSAKITLYKEYSPELFKSRPILFSFNSQLNLSQSGFGVSSSHFLIPGYRNIVYYGDDKNGNIHLYSIQAGVAFVYKYKVGVVNYDTGEVDLAPITISSFVGDYLFFYAYPKLSTVSSVRNSVVRMQNKYLTINKVAEG